MQSGHFVVCGKKIKVKVKLCHTYLPAPKTPQEGWWQTCGDSTAKRILAPTFSTTKVPLAMLYCPLVMLIIALQLLMWGSMVKATTRVHLQTLPLAKL